MKLFLFLVLFSFFSFADESRSGDAIHVGDAVKIFDQVEYQDPFLPTQVEEAWKLIQPQLNQLATKMPNTGQYLLQLFQPGRMQWWFVDVKLKDVSTASATAVIISFQNEQIAANRDGVVQVRKDLWDKLDAQSKATLLMHEALWSAIGDDCLGNGASIRLLSRYLLNPFLSQFQPFDVAQFMKTTIANEKSRLYGSVCYDIQVSSEVQKFKITDVPSGLRIDRVVEVISPSTIHGLRTTVLRPNRAFGSIRKYYRFGDQLFVDAGGNERTLKAEDLCGTLLYGNEKGWRLPTGDELTALDGEGFLGLRYIDGPVYQSASAAVKDTDVSGTMEIFIDATGAPYPLTYEAKRLWPRYKNYDWENFPYLCVK